MWQQEWAGRWVPAVRVDSNGVVLPAASAPRRQCWAQHVQAQGSWQAEQQAARQPAPVAAATLPGVLQINVTGYWQAAT